MNLYRKSIIDLEFWNKDTNRKPLLISGHRGCGKTYLVKNIFAKKYFNDKYIYIDLNKEIDILKYINNSNSKEFLSFIENKLNINITFDNLIIIDSVHLCNNFYELIKSFFINNKELKIIFIETLISENYNKPNKFKYQSFFQHLYLYQLDFYEYLYNKNKYLLDYMIDITINKKDIENKLFNEIKSEFETYLIIGGFPKAVLTFLETNDYKKTKFVIGKIYYEILFDIKENFRNIKTQIMAFEYFSKISDRLINTEDEDILRNRQLIYPIKGLESNKQIITCKCIKSLDERNSYEFIKSYMLDCGIMNYQNGNYLSESKLDNKNGNISDLLLDNYLAIELSKYNDDLYYWKSKYKSMIEFIIKIDDKFILITKKNKRNLKNCLNKIDKEKIYLVINVSLDYKYYFNYYNYEEIKIIDIPIFCLSIFLNNLKYKKA